MTHIDFTDQVTIVTGAAGGIGRAFVHEFARRGARIVITTSVLP